MPRPAPDVPQKGRKLTTAQIEAIHQVYATCGNMAEVARVLRISKGTVNKYLRKIDDAEVVELRAKAQRELAGKIHYKAHEIIDSITPEDMAKASLLQKTTSAAIFVDKEAVINANERALTGGEQTSTLLTPQTVEALRSSIKGQLSRLRIVDVQFENKNPDLAEQVASKLAAAEDITDQAEVVTLDGLDGHEPADG